jgi:tetratricopeptide (TPR) repeat protein
MEGLNDMNQVIVNSISKFPMGPNLRKWVLRQGDNYEGHSNTTPSAGEIAEFTDFMLQFLEDASPSNSNHLVDIIEELVGMNLPLLAIKVADSYPELFPQDDFRAQFHVGNASMLVSELLRAEQAFIQAQQINSEEPATYVNLTQIYCHVDELHKAKKWCLAGLNVDPNHLRLWEMLAWILQQQKGTENKNEQVWGVILKYAKDFNSWAGTALGSDLRDSDDVLFKSQALTKLWDEGCKLPDFITEYTAVLGMAGKYDAIPAVIWSAEKTQSTPLPWQAYLHLAQAYQGLGRDQDVKSTIAKLNQIKDLPESAQVAIDSILGEVEGKPQLH